MKKITTLLAVVGLLTLQSCTVSSLEIVGTTNSEVFEINTSFTYNNNYSELVTFNHPIYSTDNVLVYRLISTSGPDVWKLLPETYYLNNGAMDFGYDYDYTNYDVSIYMTGNNLQTVSDQYRFNQVLRIVIVPAGYASSIDKNNFEGVMSTLKMNDTQIQKINL